MLAVSTIRVVSGFTSQVTIFHESRYICERDILKDFVCDQLCLTATHAKKPYSLFSNSL